MRHIDQTIIIFILPLVIFISCSTGTTTKMTDKKFIEASNTAVFTTKFVTTDNKDITYVTHDKDDSAWQFFSSDKIDNLEDVAKIVGLGQIIKIDSTILELADMPVGHSAYRKLKGDKWIIEQISK